MSIGAVHVGGDIYLTVVDEDPAVVPVFAGKGSLIIWVDESVSYSKPLYYYKLTDGEDTNVNRLISRDLYTATAAPLVTNDITEGFSHGSDWYYDGDFWKCAGNDVGAAVWIKLT